MLELAFGVGLGMIVLIVMSFLARTDNRPPE
jgi:hypothetical protein